MRKTGKGYQTNDSAKYRYDEQVSRSVVHCATMRYVTTGHKSNLIQFGRDQLTLSCVVITAAAESRAQSLI
jgi:hypothetical protein